MSCDEIKRFKNNNVFNSIILGAFEFKIIIIVSHVTEETMKINRTSTNSVLLAYYIAKFLFHKK